MSEMMTCKVNITNARKCKVTYGYLISIFRFDLGFILKVKIIYILTENLQTCDPGSLKSITEGYQI